MVLGRYNDMIVITQECIPVGCVPSAAVAVSGGGEGEWPTVGVCLQVPLLELYTPPNRITDRCKNITFPQLRLRTATNSNET